MKSSLFGIAITLSLLSLPNSLKAQGKTEFLIQRPQDLAADERLKTLVSLEETCLPLNELLKKCSREGCSLTADRSCSDLKIQLRLKKRPLHVLMHSLSQLLPGYWINHASGNGYELVMTREAVLRREKWWHLFETERDRAKTEQRAFLLQKMRGGFPQNKATVPNDPKGEYSDPAVERQVAGQHSFFHDLPASLQEEIANMPTDCPLFSMGMETFGTDDEEGGLTVRLDTLPSALKQSAKNKATAIFSTGNFPFNLDNAWVSFTNGGFCVMANVITEDGKDCGTAFNFQSGFASGSSTLTFNHDPLTFEVEQLGKKAPENRKQLAAYQTSRVWQNEPSVDLNRPYVRYRRPEILNWLGAKADIEFIADYYMQGGKPMTAEAKKMQPFLPLKKELNFQAVKMDMSWKQRSDSIYLFRNNRWYRDDGLDISLSIMQRLYTLKQQSDTFINQQTSPTVALRMKPQMNLDAEVVQHLNLYQIATTLRGFFPEMLPTDKLQQKSSVPERSEEMNVYTVYPFYRDAARIMSQLNTTRFYASLDGTSRSDLINGKLLYSGLTGEQKNRVLFLMSRLRPVVSQADAPAVFLKLISRSGANFAQYGGGVRLSYSTASTP